jgi:hypothetical protein
MPPIAKRHRKNLIGEYNFPEVREIDRFNPPKNESLLCNIYLRYGKSEVSHFRCAVCREDKPESSFENYGTCKKCRDEK